MMLLLLLVPNTPYWLLATITVLFVGFLSGMVIWATILKFRYINPYTIITASNREKWRKATILALLETAGILLLGSLGLAEPVFNPHPGQWFMFPLFCVGVWIAALLLAILYERWDFERQIKNYQRIDRWIKDKSGFYHHLLNANPLTGLVRIFMTAEHKRFFSEGYPENTVNNDDNEPK